MARDLEFRLANLTRTVVRWKCRYRNLRRFLENKGVPTAYFEEYNNLMNKEFKYDSEAITTSNPLPLDAAGKAKQSQ